jgi:hypothetical protein
MPLIDRLIEQFCCSVLPNFFSRYTVPDYNEDASRNPQARVSVGSVREGIFAMQGSDILGTLGRAFGQGRTALGVVQDALLRQPSAMSAGTADPVMVSGNIVNQPVERTEALMRERGVEVERATYDPANTPNLTANLAGFFRTPAPGTKVTLYEEGGRVRYYSVSDRATAAEAVHLRGEVNTLKAELSHVQQTHLEAIAARDNEITVLRGAIESMRSDLSDLGELRAQVASLVQRQPRRRSE